MCGLSCGNPLDVFEPLVDCFDVTHDMQGHLFMRDRTDSSVSIVSGHVHGVVAIDRKCHSVPSFSCTESLHVEIRVVVLTSRLVRREPDELLFIGEDSKRVA